MIDRKLIDEIRERNNIVEVIESYIPLKKAGANFRALCPFHQEKSPSFNVNPARQIFKCFGCGKAGNVITFVQEYERLTFMEAVRKLAARAGITLPDSQRRNEAPSESDLFHRLYAAALEHYRDNLKRFGDAARQYLRERQIGDETIDKFELGYALESYGALKNYLLKAGFESSLLAKSGLFSSPERGDFHDFFRERIMFPIRNTSGQVIAFGGRVIRSEQPGGKYVNSPTTPIYTKGNDLYGLYYSRYDIAQKKQAIVVEGYLDLLRLHAHGINWSCASLGTALTTQQIRLIGRYTPNFLMLYDGDKAGRKAAIRAASEVLKEGFSPRIVALPPEEDPDTFLLHFGTEPLLAAFGEAKSLPEFLFHDKSAELGDREKIELLKQTCGEIGDEISRQLFAKESGEVFGMRPELFLQRSRIERTHERRTPAAGIDPAEVEANLIRSLFDHPEMYEKCCQFLAPEYFVSENYRKVVQLIMEHREALDAPSSLLGEMADESLRTIIADILMRDSIPATPEEMQRSFELNKYRHDLDSINRRLALEGDNEELLRQKIDLKNRISRLTKRVVGTIIA